MAEGWKQPSFGICLLHGWRQVALEDGSGLDKGGSTAAPKREPMIWVPTLLCLNLITLITISLTLYTLFNSYLGCGVAPFIP